MGLTFQLDMRPLKTVSGLVNLSSVCDLPATLHIRVDGAE
jgi:hypothetical protein